MYISENHNGCTGVPRLASGFGRVWKGESRPTPLQWAGTSSNTSGFSEPHPIWLNSSRDEESITCLGNLFQDFTILIVINVFLLSNQNLPAFSLKPFPLSYHYMPMKKSLSNFQVQEGCSKHPERLLFWSLNSPNSLILYSEEGCFSPLIIFIGLLWIHSKKRCMIKEITLAFCLHSHSSVIWHWV